MAEKNKTQLSADITSNFPDNTSGLITPAVMRTHLQNEVDSFSLQSTVVSVSGDLQSQIDGKQDNLISGNNIKTINGNSLLGSGNIEVSGGSGSVDLTPYTLLTTTASVSGDLQSQIGTKQDTIVSAGSGLDLNVAAFSAGSFSFIGGSITLLPSWTWYVGVEINSGLLRALPRLGHTGWVPVAKVTTDATNITQIDQINPVLPPTHIPRTMAKIKAGKPITVCIMGSSLLAVDPTTTTTWTGMLFNSASDPDKYLLPGTIIVKSVALGGTPNQYQLAQLGMIANVGDGYPVNSSGAWLDGFDVPTATGLVNGRSTLLDGVDVVIIGCLANGGDLRLDTIEAIARKLKQRGVEVVMVTDNASSSNLPGAGISYETMMTADLFRDGYYIMDSAHRYGYEIADTAAYVFEAYYRYNAVNIYSDGIHPLTGQPPAGPNAQPSCGSEVWARAVRSVFGVSSYVVPAGNEAITYTFDTLDGVSNTYGNTTVALSSGALRATKNGNFWGFYLAIPRSSFQIGDTVRVQGTLSVSAGYGVDPRPSLILRSATLGSTNLSNTAVTTDGAFDLTLTATSSIITDDGRLFIYGGNTTPANGEYFELDNVIITQSYAQSVGVADIARGRGITEISLPPCRRVTSTEIPGDALVVLPHQMRNDGGTGGALMAHPAGANSFARRWSPLVDSASDMRRLTTGQRVTFYAPGVVGIGIIRYSSTGEGSVGWELYANGSLMTSGTIASAGLNREMFQIIRSPLTLLPSLSAIRQNRGFHLLVTSGTLDLAAVVILTADMTWIPAHEIKTVGTGWARGLLTSRNAPGYETNVPGDWAAVQAPEDTQTLSWVTCRSPEGGSGASAVTIGAPGNTVGYDAYHASSNYVELSGHLTGGGMHRIRLNTAGTGPAGLGVTGVIAFHDR